MSHDATHAGTDDLASLVDRQAATIDRQEEVIQELRETVDDQQEIIEALKHRLETETAGDLQISRRGALKAGGVLAALGVGGAGTASADSQGQIGTSGDPLNTLYTAELNGALTGDQAVTNLLGKGLTVDGGTLSLRTETTETQLTVNDLEIGDYLGISVAVSDDGSTTVVGAQGKEKAYVFDADGSRTATLTLSDSSILSSVGVSSDGSRIVVGNPEADRSTGEAYVFDAAGNRTATLTASDRANGDNFGDSVAISDNGSTVVVGADRKDSDRGKAYVFDADGTQTATLTASDRQADDSFGISVGVNADGSTVVVGAAGADSFRGKAYVFDASGTQTATLTASDRADEDSFGFSVGVNTDGSRIAVGAAGADSLRGKAYVFDGSGNQTTALTANDRQEDDLFGASIGISDDGSRIIVGARGADSSRGKAYVFDGGGSQTAALTASDRQDDDLFGKAVAISDDKSTIVVGAPADGAGNQIGKAYRYDAGVNFGF